VSDAQIQATIANWEPRFVANGVDVNDFHRIAKSVSTWPEWLPAWEAHGDALALEATDAEGRACIETAGELWRRAALSYHFGRFVWMVDMDRHRVASKKATDALQSAHRLLDPTAERLEIPFDGAQMVAILRRPPGVERPPLVVLIPGLDSTKEEFFSTEEVFHERGLATLTLEGPGQGETSHVLPIRADFEVPFGAALDFIADRNDVDLDRIGTIGFSLGGYYAPRVAAYEPRLKAAVGVSGPYSMIESWDDRPLMTRATFQYHAGANTEAEAKEVAATLSLEGVAERIQQPLLIITGDGDRLVPWRETKRIADEAPNATWKLYEGGNHVVNNMPYKYKTLSADWLREQLHAAA
jgi:2,6-dihydroxypseudooxynicotine hydrolase